jgi:hypothetical protein
MERAWNKAVNLLPLSAQGTKGGLEYTVLMALYPRDIGFDHRHKAAGIQMPPLTWAVIVDGAVNSARGAREFCRGIMYELHRHV